MGLFLIPWDVQHLADTDKFEVLTQARASIELLDPTLMQMVCYLICVGYVCDEVRTDSWYLEKFDMSKNFR